MLSRGTFLIRGCSPGAPPLVGEPEFKVSEDEMIASDGVRAYHYRFFEKQGKLYGVRVIGHGNVCYQIIVK